LGTQADLEVWCVYVLRGILDELKKVDRLADFDYLNDKILAPALRYARERQLITAMEEDILHIAARTGITKSIDLISAMPEMSQAQRTYQIKKLVERKMLLPVKEGGRQYTIGFSNNYLMRGVVQSLAVQGFVPQALNKGH
jgi:Fic family protein